MKIIVVVATLLILCGGVAVWLATHIRPHVVAPHAEITVREASGAVASLPPATAESIQSWLAQHQSGWRPSFVTYAPQITFSADTFHINILRDVIILNYSGNSLWWQVTRRLSREERTFWESFTCRRQAA